MALAAVGFEPRELAIVWGARPSEHLGQGGGFVVVEVQPAACGGECVEMANARARREGQLVGAAERLLPTEHLALPRKVSARWRLVVMNSSAGANGWRPRQAQRAW